MKNAIMPFILIMVIGVAAMFLMSFKGLSDMEKIAAEGENGDTKVEDTASATPEELYQKQGCVACHGGDYTGGLGPSLLGVGEKFTHDELVDILINGIPGTAMPGGFPADKADAMSEWLATLK